MSEYTGPERRKTDHPLKAASAAFITQAAGSRFTLAGIVVVVFGTLGVLSYGVLEQSHQFSRAQQRQERLLEVNNTIMEFLEDFAIAESKADADGRAALAQNLRCVALMFVPGEPLGPPSPEIVERCFDPVPEAPDPKEVKENNHNNP